MSRIESTRLNEDMKQQNFYCTRRQFMGRSACALGALAAFQSPILAAAGSQLPKRRLGQTDLMVSILGMGTGHLHEAPSEKEALDLIRYMRNEGINYFDTAHNYGCGHAERLLGTALCKERDRVVIATKTRSCAKKGALRELEKSLRRLRTDYVDAWQIHGANEWDREACFAQGGVIEAMEIAKRQGKCRYVGVCGFSSPDELRAYLRAYPFDTVTAPFNCVDPHYLSFEKGLLPTINRSQIGIAGMKVFITDKISEHCDVSREEALRYTLSLPITSILMDCVTLKQAQRDIATVRTFQPLSENEKRELLARTEQYAGRLVEWYKRIV